ncbi:hypothetical protein [Geitlerinema sp. PCC 7407]|uniref:hypothetical protein n=1 Tax=Geitlerinema sp. PCC 7407 TaxID=1173025 RepID=UPI00167F8E0E|nr:hypothetical protein [Geitlerinema sp. PCC 7407]
MIRHSEIEDGTGHRESFGKVGDRTKSPPQRHCTEAPIGTSAQPVFEAIASGGLISG